MKRKSKYKSKRALHGTVVAKATSEKIKDSAIQTGKDLLIGVIGGGLLGAVIGKPSLLIGIGVTGYGHFSKKPMLSTFGIGMMAASGFTPSVNGMDGFSKEDIKARLMNFKEGITSKLFLDKIIKKKNTNGVGAIQDFEHPLENRELDFSALDQLQNNIVQSGMEYKKSMQGLAEVTMASEEIPKTMYGNEEIDFINASY